VVQRRHRHVEATCPPGGGPAPHIHPNSDETFYPLSGELEFLKYGIALPPA